MDPAPGELRRIFDWELFARKLHTPARRMQIETRSRWRAAKFQWRKLHQSSETGLFTTLVDIGIAVLREYLEEIDRIAREVWRAQGYAVTVFFLREVLQQEISTVIAARKGPISEEFSRRLSRRSNELTPVSLHLAWAVRQLEADMANRYEIEARELAYRNTPNQSRSVIEQGRLKVKENQTELRRIQVDPGSMKRASRQKSMRRSAATRIGRNIDRLRKECAWSLNKLAGETGIDKKLVVSHVHGKHKPNPKTLGEYAQAFTRQLHRSITANQLEE
jgi:hypothetical protein